VKILEEALERVCLKIGARRLVDLSYGPGAVVGHGRRGVPGGGVAVSLSSCELVFRLAARWYKLHELTWQT